MRSDEQRYKTIGLMIFTAIIIFSVVGIVIIGFKMLRRMKRQSWLLLPIQNI